MVKCRCKQRLGGVSDHQIHPTKSYTLSVPEGS
uniref:Uncharacterized protein n=1 Tax=Anguilla anguilla TaxID=7936 RepID=A0A0E9XPX8_ANGAN